MTRVAGVPEQLSGLSRALTDVAPDVQQTVARLGSMSLPEMPPGVAGVVADTLGSVGGLLTNVAATVQNEGLDAGRRATWFAIADEGGRIIERFPQLPPFDGGEPPDLVPPDFGQHGPETFPINEPTPGLETFPTNGPLPGIDERFPGPIQIPQPSTGITDGLPGLTIGLLPGLGTVFDSKSDEGTGEGEGEGDDNAEGGGNTVGGGEEEPPVTVGTIPQGEEDGNPATGVAQDDKPSYPTTPEEMDKLAGEKGTPVPDGPNTPGRGKVIWTLPDGTKITYEQHPYDQPAPDYHRNPHWHIDIPGERPHQRRMPGDPFP